MKESLNVICRLCFTNEGEGLIFQRFIIMSFNIIKQVLLCPEFKMPKQIDDEETKNCPSVQAHQTKIDFFQQSTVEEICKCLISQYLLLSKDDLELWDSDPEQYGEFEFQISMEYENQFHIKKKDQLSGPVYKIGFSFILQKSEKNGPINSVFFH